MRYSLFHLDRREATTLQAQIKEMLVSAMLSGQLAADTPIPSTRAMARRLDVSRNSIYASIRNEQAGTISLNQLEKIADAMGGRLVYAIVPREGPVEEIVLTQARAKARRIIQRTRAHMALEEQSEGLRSEEEMVEELAADIIREGRRDFWQ